MAVTYLLDTHVLLWLLGDPSKIPTTVRHHLAQSAHTLLVSAASALEVSTKVRLGKLPAGAALVEAWSSRLAAIGCEELPVTSAHALFAGSMEWTNRDPFDRLLVAQTVLDTLTLVTTDDPIRILPAVPTLSW